MLYEIAPLSFENVLIAAFAVIPELFPNTYSIESVGNETYSPSLLFFAVTFKIC